MPDPKKAKEYARHLESLMKGLQILDCLQGRPQMTLAELAGELGAYKSRIMRLCGTLEHMGYVVFDAQERVYRLGPRIPSLARVYESSNPLLPAIKPTLEYLFTTLKQVIAFHRLHDNGKLCIYRLSEGLDYSEPSVQQERALHSGAPGRVLLAFAPEEFRRDFFSGDEEYPRLTPNTITTKEALWEEVLRTREKGYAETFEERTVGLVGIAAPVFQYSNVLVGAISIAGKKEYFNDDFRRHAIRLLLEETSGLSARFGAGKGGDAVRQTA